ncbi:M56 family metallopeptidase [Robertkochia sediminum]|uniref:M56 family metallopeptidase n=1 Tax=Robertkochia sediminum TaxID=2785326 RepID=UPI001931C945|nr:M56 family metallopeptidase [Robertkochia sediminum]MBL7473877.1 M56 family metallopeptidase [Robertkochia sediminum]
MIRYLIIMLSCQLLFLLVYDLFLKKETFFNWNRVYLLVTPLLSLVIPFIRLDALTTTAPEILSAAAPAIFLEPQAVSAVQVVAQESGNNLNTWEWLAIAGSSVAFLFFAYKLLLLLRLRQTGFIRRFRDYLQVEVPQSEIAFSFFRQIFLGNKVLERKHDHIIEHELVHIREGHTWDLLYFEVLRILFWFNPLVYVFQARITELHEYIADAKMAGNGKKETYQYLLEEVFQTQKISFVNSFFNHSLIKKRIVMLHQNRSKQIRKFKYLLMIPLLLGMLVYTSCEQEVDSTKSSPVEGLDPQVQKYYHEYKAMIESGADIFELTKDIYSKTPDGEIMSEEYFYRTGALWLLKKETFDESVGLSDELKEELDRLVKMTYKQYLMTKKQEKNPVYTFTSIAEKPSFQVPCEEGADAFTCFKEQLDDHVIKTFRYPEEAREKGIQGRVYLNFKIDTDGSISILQTRAPHELLDAEARRIIESLPKLNPGKKADGTPVPITFAYPIIFKLGDGVEADSESVVVKNDIAGSSEVPFTTIPVKPSFKTPCADGQEAFACFKEKLNAHVIATFQYPEEAKAAGIEGKVYLNFRIDTDGNVKVINSRAPHELLDTEARRIIESLPVLNPGGDENGNPVPVSFAYPIVFKL